jgi:hypothetical protein
MQGHKNRKLIAVRGREFADFFERFIGKKYVQHAIA